MMDLFTIKGKTVLVTGGSRGIGFMIATGFIEYGAKVYIAARKATACKEAATQLSKKGTCVAIAEDLSTEAGVKALTDEIKKREEKLDILVNNAGAT